MTKAIVQIGYSEYVLDVDKAITLLEAVAEAEVYKEKWKPKEQGGATHHIYEQEQEEKGVRHLKIISNSTYKMWKLAGKPAD